MEVPRKYRPRFPLQITPIVLIALGLCLFVPVYMIRFLAIVIGFTWIAYSVSFFLVYYELDRDMLRSNTIPKSSLDLKDVISIKYKVMQGGRSFDQAFFSILDARSSSGITIPRFGWRKTERRELFRHLLEIIPQSAEIDDRTRVKLDKMVA